MKREDRIETRDVVRRGERTIQVRVIEYPAHAAAAVAAPAAKR